MQRLGLCASACHEGAIRMVGGKAKLAREDYCDGLGDCLPWPDGCDILEERKRRLTTTRRYGRPAAKSAARNRCLRLPRHTVEKARENGAARSQ